MQVRVYSQDQVEKEEILGSSIISITGKNEPDAKISTERFPKGIWKTKFDDIALDTFLDTKGNQWIGPSIEQVEQSIDFARKLRQEYGDSFTMAVHCKHGKSRSAAIALAIYADYLGWGNEENAVINILQYDHQGQICFNPLIVRFADQILERESRIENTLVKVCPRFCIWKKYWEKKGF